MMRKPQIEVSPSLSLQSIMVGEERGWNVFIPVILTCRCEKRMEAGMILALEVGV